MLEIVTHPNDSLKRESVPCDITDKSLKRTAKQMLKIMYDNDGCGLAAPQVGLNIRLVVIDCDQADGERNPIVLINPVIEETWGELQTENEGCLSFPGISVPVERPAFARVRFLDFDGEEWELEGDGLLGRCLQHEIDHLDGKTMIDRCTPFARLNALEDYKKALASGAKPGQTSVK